MNVHTCLARGLPYRFIGSASASAYPLAQTRRQTKYINAVHAEVTGNTRPATKVLNKKPLHYNKGNNSLELKVTKTRLQ